MNFEGTIKSKLPQTGTTIFSVMSGLAAECNAINLSQGFPSFPVSEALISLVNQYMRKGANQYAPMPGIMSLREGIAQKMEKLYGVNYNPETEITITAGGTQAIFTVISAVVKEDDEVIIFDPAYDSYAPSVVLVGGMPIHYDLIGPDYKVDWNVMKKLITQRTRMIIINTPHNPTGSVLNADDMLMLEKLVLNSNIIILSDEVYEHVIYDGIEHQSVCRYPKLAERSMVVFSFGKTYHATGWKMGYILAPEILMTEFRRVHQFNVFSVNTPIQMALADYLKEEEHYLQLGNFYQAKRDMFRNLIAPSRFKIMDCSGSYFQLLDYSAITDEKDTDFAIRMTKEFGVASIPVSVFYQRKVDNKLLRFCFAKDDKTLKSAAEKLCAI